MDAKPSLTLYNPHLLSKADLILGFVARKPLLDKLLDDLRRTGIEGSPQHHLLLGQRGQGKTTLLRRLAFAIDDNPELAAIWQPLTFPEEQYNVTNLAEFWLNCADALSDALERSGRKAEAESLDQCLENMKGKDSAQALATLLEEAQRLNRKLVLLVDNIDIVLERIGKDQEWELRRNLTENSALTVIGGSSRALEAFYEHERAFYDFFQVHELKGLDDDEAKALLNHLARELNSAQVDRILKEQPARLRALRVLTGGNPRTLVLLFRVFDQGPEGDVQHDLEQLLDLYTPLYKARFEELPKQAQDVVDEIALNWDPVTAADVARLTGLHINVASSQLQRLLELGVIEKVPWFGAKKTGFQIAERFFNIWYLMRASRRLRRKLVWLVKFLQAWFTEEEVRDRARNLLDHGAELLGPERFAELPFAYAQATTDEGSLRMEPEGLLKSRDIHGLIESIPAPSLEKEHLSTAEQLAREAVAILPDNIAAKIVLAEVLTRAKNWTEARAIVEPIFTNLATEPDASINAFCAAAVATRKTAELLEFFNQTGTNERWRPLYEAIKAVQAGSKLYLRRISPEVRHPAQRLLKEIAPNLGE